MRTLTSQLVPSHAGDRIYVMRVLALLLNPFGVNVDAEFNPATHTWRAIAVTYPCGRM